eukprot:2499821-Rhodomonas_salina.1
MLPTTSAQPKARHPSSSNSLSGASRVSDSSSPLVWPRSRWRCRPPWAPRLQTHLGNSPAEIVLFVAPK